MCKCWKEEVPTRVVVDASQCMKGRSKRWAPYLLNSFLENYKDTQDWGSEFHYSWLLTLIELVGWKRLMYNMFLQRIGKCSAARYTSLRSIADPKGKKINSYVFVL
jgi:hypothetical protein